MSYERVKVYVKYPELFWYYISTNVDGFKAMIQYNGVSKPVATFRITSIKGTPC